MTRALLKKWPGQARVLPQISPPNKSFSYRLDQANPSSPLPLYLFSPPFPPFPLFLSFSLSFCLLLRLSATCIENIMEPGSPSLSSSIDQSDIPRPKKPSLFIHCPFLFALLSVNACGFSEKRPAGITVVSLSFSLCTIDTLLTDPLPFSLPLPLLLPALYSGPPSSYSYPYQFLSFFFFFSFSLVSLSSILVASSAIQSSPPPPSPSSLSSFCVSPSRSTPVSLQSICVSVSLFSSPSQPLCVFAYSDVNSLHLSPSSHHRKMHVS